MRGENKFRKILEAEGTEYNPDNKIEGNVLKGNKFAWVFNEGNMRNETENTKEKDVGDDKKIVKTKNNAKEVGENPNEAHAEKIDKIFNELLESVKDAPEAKKEALKILIGQMRQIAEQLKQTRDMRHMEALKREMLENWQKLVEMTNGDSALLKAITEWGKKFAQEKVVYHELMGEVKDELIDKAQEIQSTWNKMQISIGQIVGTLTKYNPAIEELIVNKYLRRLRFPEPGESAREFTARPLFQGSSIENFIERIQSVDLGFDEQDIDVQAANDFSTNLTNMTRELSVKAFTPKAASGSPELGGLLNDLVEQSNTLSRQILGVSKIYKFTKKIRDTHFLPLFAEGGPEQLAVAA